MRRIEEVVETANTCSVEVAPGKWAPARPIPSSVIWHRIRDAWAVLIGKADAVCYPEGGNDEPRTGEEG